MKTIELRKDHLAALLLTAGDRDIRYYLNGVCLDVLAGYSRLVSTNGHILAVAHVPHTFMLDGLPSQYIIPRDVIEHFKPKKGAETRVLLTILDAEHGIMSDQSSGLSMSFYFVQGKFPAYTKVIPRKVSGLSGQFKPGYVAIWPKIAKLMGDREGKAFIHHNGQDNGALVTFVDNSILGVMMPWRGVDIANYKLPDWL